MQYEPQVTEYGKPASKTETPDSWTTEPSGDTSKKKVPATNRVLDTTRQLQDEWTSPERTSTALK
jgi:hypothetical protein